MPNVSSFLRCAAGVAQSDSSNVETTVEFVAKQLPKSINSQDSRGQTPLHLAAGLDRRDVLPLLLEVDGVDDMVRDQSGKTCLETASTAEAAGIISSRSASFSDERVRH